jgi:hypothetical protein
MMAEMDGKTSSMNLSSTFSHSRSETALYANLHDESKVNPDIYYATLKHSQPKANIKKMHPTGRV